MGRDNLNNTFTCPCCGYITLSEGPDSYEICPICFWEDDLTMLRFPSIGGGANETSLIDAQKMYAKIGTSEKRMLPNVRKPNEQDKRDPHWRPIDPAKDYIEILRTGKDYGVAYHSDSTVYNYWQYRRFSDGRIIKLEL